MQHVSTILQKCCTLVILLDILVIKTQIDNYACMQKAMSLITRSVTKKFLAAHEKTQAVSEPRYPLSSCVLQAARSKAASSPFTDVNSSNYYKDVLWDVKNEIAAGTLATTFSPNAACTRAHFLVFLYRDMLK